MNNLIIFIISLSLTGIITRVLTHFLHDRKNYNKRTVTGFLRTKTKKDIHHIHFGFMLIALSLILILVFGINTTNTILLAIGLSFIADQIFPLFKVCDYFYWKGIMFSVLNHIILVLISILIYMIYPILRF